MLPVQQTMLFFLSLRRFTYATLPKTACHTLWFSCSLHIGRLWLFRSHEQSIKYNTTGHTYCRPNTYTYAYLDSYAYSTYANAHTCFILIYCCPAYYRPNTTTISPPSH